MSLQENRSFNKKGGRRLLFCSGGCDRTRTCDPYDVNVMLQATEPCPCKRREGFIFFLIFSKNFILQFSVDKQLFIVFLFGFVMNFFVF